MVIGVGCRWTLNVGEVLTQGLQLSPDFYFPFIIFYVPMLNIKSNIIIDEENIKRKKSVKLSFIKL